LQETTFTNLFASFCQQNFYVGNLIGGLSWSLAVKTAKWLYADTLNLFSAAGNKGVPAADVGAV
jgi:hypothetical protein